MKMELIEGSETSANHNRTPGKYPNEYIQDSKHGESLKSRLFSSPNRPDRLWFPSSLLFDGCREGKAAGTWSYLPSSSSEDKNEWSCTSPPNIYLHGVEKFTFFNELVKTWSWVQGVRYIECRLRRGILKLQIIGKYSCMYSRNGVDFSCAVFGL